MPATTAATAVPAPEARMHVARGARTGVPLTLEEVAATIDDGIIVLDTSWRIAFVNAAAARILECEPETLIGQDHWERFPRTVGTEVERIYRRAMADGKPADFEHGITETGRWYHVRTHRSHLGLTITFGDITDRKHADASRDLVAERFRVAAATPWLTLYEQDADLRYTWLYPPHPQHNHALGRTDDELSRDGSLDQLAAKKREVMATGVPARMTAAVKLPSGGERHYDTYISPRRDAAGRIIGVTGAGLDVSVQRRAEIALRENEARLQANALHQQLLYRLVASVNRAATSSEVYEAALDALCQSQGCARGSILLSDDAGVMRFVAWRGLSDEYRAAVEGHSPWSKDDADPQPVCFASIADCPLDEHLRSVVQKERIAALAFIPLTVERRLIGKFMVYFDEPHEFAVDSLQMAETIARQVSFAIERQRSAEQLESLVRERTASLREAIQQMEEFSYTVSHDLRAPIRGMLTFTNVILEDHGRSLSPEVLEYLGRIAKNASRMDALVRDTLAYSRVARGQLTFTNVSLDDCTAQAIAESGAASRVTVAAPLGHVVASEPLLMQVLTNLLGNAVKFVRRDTTPQIVVSSEHRGARLRVRVRDNGIGIPSHQQTRIFGMFERLHASTEYEGTGIGLAIVRKAIDRMGGQIGVESDGVSGSTFWIELPSAEVQA